MTAAIREARMEDVDLIVPWTTDTFSWGDYVPERLPGWISGEDSVVQVCVDQEDIPIALAHTTLLSPTEAWIEGARVHPEHQRKGLGTLLNHSGLEWAGQHGARVIRLATESDNTAARSQVEKLGYRPVSAWVAANLKPTRTTEVANHHRFRPANAADAEGAWLSWAAGDLARAGRDMLAIGWQWRTAAPEDLFDNSLDNRLFQSGSGWVLADHPEPGWIRSRWIATSAEDLPGLLEGAIDLARRLEATELSVKLPETPWTVEALRRAGGRPFGVEVYAKPIF